jgi:dephospho-CoA kinase
MRKVGITGNIGSGKTLSCLVFKKLGIPVFEADVQAKLLYAEPDIKQKMCSRFGDEIYFENGQLNRQLIAKKLFADSEAMSFVNGLIHPVVRNRFSEWCEQFQEKPFVLYEAAILFETGYHKQLDDTILVTAPEALRIKRVMERDQVDRSAIRNRMKFQWAEEKKIPLATYILKNDEEHLIIPQALAIYRAMVKKQEI